MARTSKGPKAIVGVHTPVEPEVVPVEPEPVLELLEAKVDEALAQGDDVAAEGAMFAVLHVLADGTRVKTTTAGDVYVETPTPAPYRETF